MAADACERGKVLVNRSTAKPSRKIQVNDVLLVEKGPYRWLITVVALSEQRVSASVAKEMYVEASESVNERERRQEILKQDRLSRPVSDHRPDKRERRKLISTKKDQSS